MCSTAGQNNLARLEPDQRASTGDSWGTATVRFACRRCSAAPACAWTFSTAAQTTTSHTSSIALFFSLGNTWMKARREASSMQTWTYSQLSPSPRRGKSHLMRAAVIGWCARSPAGRLPLWPHQQRPCLSLTKPQQHGSRHRLLLRKGYDAASGDGLHGRLWGLHGGLWGVSSSASLRRAQPVFDRR